MTSDIQLSTAELTAGPIDYIDTGGDGPTVVLLHGVLMTHTVWNRVIAELAPRFRCIAPTLPLGAHRQPMRPGADLSIDGIALLVAELLERLELGEVTLIMNDWGGPQLLVDHGRTERISRLVLVACEAFETSRPGYPGAGSPSSPPRPAGSGYRACWCGPRAYAVRWRPRWPNTPCRVRCCATGSSPSSEIGRYGKICAATASACRSTAAAIGRPGSPPLTSRPWWYGPPRTR